MRFPDLRLFARPRLPVVLQTEASECGLACLAMIAQFHGRRSDLPAMRRRFALSLKGATLKTLMSVARALGMNSRPLKLALEDLPQLRVPCVLHWDMNHFVVLREVRAKEVMLHDPAVGARRLPLEEVSKHFTGVALELTPGSAFVRVDERRPIKILELMGGVRGLASGLAQLLLVGVALQVCALVLPFFLQWVVDEALVSADRDLVTVLGVGFLLLVAIQTALGTLRSWITTQVATDVNFQWLTSAFGHLMQLPLSWFERRHLGDVVSRFGSIQTIQQALTTQFVEAGIDGLLVFATLAMMLLYSPALTAVSIVAVALYGMTRWFGFRALRDAKAEQIIHAAKQSTQLLESARGVQSVRLFGKEDERRIAWSNTLADQFNADLRIARLSISMQTVHAAVFGVERIAVIWLAALAVIDARFTAGMLFAFLSYKDQFTQRIAALIDKAHEWQLLRLHGERVADIVHSEPESLEPGDLENLMNGDIEVRGLSFRYADDEPWILQDLSLTIPSGQFLAITGPSGCGKSTLAKLLLGLLTPTTGEIRVGGKRITPATLGAWRRSVGTVMQDDGLFSGSIADNISFFDPLPDKVRIAICAEAAAIREEIEAMPMQYHTLIGDIGSALSGGQRQRILLARALYKEPKFLILDEATSHLDMANEMRVNESLRRLTLTRIAVAHRHETIAAAERVVVLDRGQIVRDLARSDGHDVQRSGMAHV